MFLDLETTETHSLENQMSWVLKLKSHISVFLMFHSSPWDCTSVYSLVLVRKSHREFKLIHISKYIQPHLLLGMFMKMYKGYLFLLLNICFHELWRALLRTNESACCNLMSVGRRHETCESETKFHLLLTELAITRLIINIWCHCWNPNSHQWCQDEQMTPVYTMGYVLGGGPLA